MKPLGNNMNKRAIGIFTIIVLSQVILVPIISVRAAIDSAELAEESITINANIQENFFRGDVAGGLEGIGDNLGRNIDSNTNNYPFENAVGYAGFNKRYQRSGVSELADWAETDCLSSLKFLQAGEILEREDEEDVFYVSDQGAVLEFVSEGYKISQDQNARDMMERIYNKMSSFESSPNNDIIPGYGGAYWRAIDDSDEIYEPEADRYRFCFANDSLWALIGILNFGLTIKGQNVDLENNYYENAVTRALSVIEFLEDECYYNGSGFKEYPYADMANPKSNRFYFNTQVLAVLAYTRLYEATEEQVYLDKANMMVEYIITKNFLDTGNTTGCVSWLSNSLATKSNVKLGYDNALYAYALMNLYGATGESDPKTLRRAEEITKFMNDNMYDEAANGEITGYVEYLVDDKIPTSTNNGQYRYYKTNALMLFANEELNYFERPWYVKYMVYLVIGIVGLIGLIVILILVRKRGRRGTKIPKMVSGLIDEEA